MNTYTVKRHPEADRAGSLFQWAIYRGTKLFTACADRLDAQLLANNYNTGRAPVFF